MARQQKRGRSYEIGELRKTARREVAALRKKLDSMTTAERAGRQGRSTERQILEIERANAGTYLRGPNKRTPLEVEKNVNVLRSLTGAAGKSRRATQQARQNRIFYQQMRIDTKAARADNLDAGIPSEYFGGVAGRLHYEKIFYMSTQDLWVGSDDPKERNQKIMDALGVDSLEEAYRIVLSENTDVIAKILEAIEDGQVYEDYFEEFGSGTIAAMMVGRGAEIARKQRQSRRPTTTRRRRKK